MKMGVSGMTMFGISIRLEKISESPFVDGVVNDVFKREDERKVFMSFLQSNTVDGNKIEDEIVKSSEIEANRLTSEGAVVDKNELLTFVVTHLKKMKNGKVSVYESIIRKIVENQNPEFKQLHKSIDSGKFDGKIPFGYPDASKMALSIFTAKVKDGLELTQPEYLKRKIVENKIRFLAREMFYCVNRGSSDVACNYLSIRYEMFKLKSADELNTNIIRDVIIKSLITGEELTVLSPKCLRFSYPYGNRLKILNHTGSEVIIKKDGSKYLFRDENIYLSKLTQLKNMFEVFGVKTNFILLVMDRDVSDYFPLDGGGIIPEQDLSACTYDIAKYTSIVSKQLEQYGIKVTTLTNFLGPDFLKEFLSRKSERLLKAKKGILMRENFIENRIEYYFESKKQIFEKAPDKDFSRVRVYSELASQQSLDVFNEMYPNYLVVSDNLFNMSSVLGDGKIPAYFADLGKDIGFNVE